MFVIGTAFADLETLEDWRPLDILRELPFPLAMLKNLVLIFLFLTYGSFNGGDNCEL